MKRIFPAVKLRPQTPPIDKREIGDAAIPGERRIHTSPAAPLPSQLGLLANERAISSDFKALIEQHLGRKGIGNDTRDVLYLIAKSPWIGDNNYKYHEIHLISPTGTFISMV